MTIFFFCWSRNGFEDVNGCRGGHVNASFNYILQNGLGSGQDQPYVGQESRCHQGPRLATMSNYLKLTEGDELSMMKTLVTNGPITAYMDSTGLQFYTGSNPNVSSCNQSF